MEEELVINPRVGWRIIDDDLVVFNCKNQEIVIWNETAAQLWKLLVAKSSFTDLKNWLIDEYQIDEEQAINDVNHFIKTTLAEGLIKDVNKRVKISKIFESRENEGENTLLAIEMKAIKKQIPFAITFETTYSCNEKCIHCYMDRSLPALSLIEIKKILQDIAKSGCLFLSLTGGEFFTRVDAYEILSYAAELHFVIDILSNGTLIDENAANLLSQYPVRRVQVSLYGATSVVHDKITNTPGSFNNTIRGISYLRQSGIKVEIAFPLMSTNFSQRYAVRDLAASLDCLISPSPIITARNNGADDTHGLRLNQYQLQKFLADKSLSGLYAGRKPFKDHQMYFKFNNILEAAPCYSGFNSCAITPEGIVLPCNQLLYPVGDLKKDSFTDIWQNSRSLFYLRQLKLRDLNFCSTCRLLNSCSRCPGLALLEGGDLLGPSPENCRIAKMQNTSERR